MPVVEIAITAAGVCVIATAISSLWWPHYHDASIMEYAGWLVRHGYRPYVDFFDMNLPGTYVFYAVGQSIFGNSDLSFRIRDLLVLGAGCYAMFRLLRPFSATAAAAGVVLLATRYLAFGGAADSLQRDWLVAILVIGAVAILMDGKGRALQRAMAGAALGYACTIKPQALIVMGLVPIFVWLRAWSTRDDDTHRGGVLRTSLEVAGGAAVAIGLVAGWLVASGSWGGFQWMVTKYLPLYSRLDGGGFAFPTIRDALAHSFTFARGRIEVPLLTFGVAVLLLRRRPREQAARLVVLVLLLTAGFFHAVLGIKGWDYHFWPFVVLSVAIVAVSIGDLRARRWAPWQPTSAQWTSRLSSVAFLFVFFRQVGFTARAIHEQAQQHPHFRDVLPRPWLVATFLPLAALAAADLLHAPGLADIRDRIPRAGRSVAIATVTCAAIIAPLLIGSLSATSVAFDVTATSEFSSPYVPMFPDQDKAVAAMLRARATRNDRVQILDTTLGGADVLLRAGLQPASRFIYDFHFYHDVGTAVNTRLRRELMQDLTRTPPRFILFFVSNWGARRGYAIDDFPELAAFIGPYHLIYEDPYLRLLER